MAAGYNARKFNVASEELQYIDSYAKVDRIVGQIAELRDAVGTDLDGRLPRPRPCADGPDPAEGTGASAPDLGSRMRWCPPMST